MNGKMKNGKVKTIIDWHIGRVLLSKSESEISICMFLQWWNNIMCTSGESPNMMKMYDWLECVLIFELLKWLIQSKYSIFLQHNEILYICHEKSAREQEWKNSDLQNTQSVPCSPAPQEAHPNKRNIEKENYTIINHTFRGITTLITAFSLIYFKNL